MCRPEGCATLTVLILEDAPETGNGVGEGRFPQSSGCYSTAFQNPSFFLSVSALFGFEPHPTKSFVILIPVAAYLHLNLSPLVCLRCGNTFSRLIHSSARGHFGLLQFIPGTSMRLGGSPRRFEGRPCAGRSVRCSSEIVSRN